MMEHTYYSSGHWAWHCTDCGVREVFVSVAACYASSKRHYRDCGT